MEKLITGRKGDSKILSSITALKKLCNHPKFITFERNKLIKKLHF